jgi:hypothetical protein
VLAVIVLRVALFLAVFFALRWLSRRLELPPGLPLALVLLGASTFVAFAATALLLGHSVRSALVVWAVLYAIIAGLWYLRNMDLPQGR